MAWEWLKQQRSNLYFGLAVAGLVAWGAGVLYLAQVALNYQSTPHVPPLAVPGAEAPSGPTADVELAAMIAAWASEAPGEYAVVVREVTEPLRMSAYREEASFIAASTYKLFLVYAILFHVEQGDLPADAVTANGMTIDECIESLLVYSWDDCGWPLGDLLGWPRISNFLHNQGFSDTHLDNYDAAGNFVGDKFSTARDQAEFAWRLYHGELFAERAHTELMLSKMSRQVWGERIPAGLPPEANVANKPGWIYAIENDTAIVYGTHSTYILVIMSDGAGVEHLAELSRLIYDYLHREV